jgi:hypothetical protein
MTIHKAMQTAHAVDRIIAGPQMQMIGIGEDYLCADGLQVLVETAPLMAATVATFIKTGVCTSPCTVLSTARFARPSSLRI